MLCESGSTGHLHHDHGSYVDLVHGCHLVMIIDHGGDLDHDYGGSLDQDEVVQVFSGEETVLVLLNFLPKPAMVVYNSYTAESVSYFLACICLFVCLFYLGFLKIISKIIFLYQVSSTFKACCWLLLF